MAGTSLASVQKALARGRISAEPDGSIDFEKADAAWEASTDKARQRPTNGAAVAAVPSVLVPLPHNSTFAEGQRQLQWLRVQKERLDLDERRGKLVSADEVETFVGGMIEMCKTTLLAIPRELRDRLALEDDPIACEELMANSIRSALVHLSQYRPPGQPEPAA
jgi:hypothetical protein